MPATKKRVLVIGAGPSGLCSIKECLEIGLDVICFEQQSNLGGLWTGHSDWSSIYESTIVNTSKEYLYSDLKKLE
jgi:dimethylaniline monooxygenase (N-oxide forming)